MRFSEKNYPIERLCNSTTMTTRQQLRQLINSLDKFNNNFDNSTTITTLFSYMLMLSLLFTLFNGCSVVVHVVEWLLNSCSRCCASQSIAMFVDAGYVGWGTKAPSYVIYSLK